MKKLNDMIPVFHEVQGQVKQTERKEISNEYYKTRWSDNDNGIVYIKKREGYSMVRYGKMNDTLWVDWTERRSSFEELDKKGLIQISKLDALPALQLLREKVLAL